MFGLYEFPLRIYKYAYTCMNVSMNECMYVCMYVCMNVHRLQYECMYAHIQNVEKQQMKTKNGDLILP